MSTALSEKAKGKQRAVAPDADAVTTPPSKALTIRFTEGIPDLTLQVAEKDSVKEVKAKIRLARPQLEDRRLRLIYSGQLLADNTQLYPRIDSVEQKRKRPTLSSSGGEEGDEDGETSSIVAPTWLHCSVGPQLKDGEEEEGRIQTAQLKPLRGFDRLAAAGFSEQDIANIRLQFHAHSAGDYLDEEFDDQEDFDEHARALEEQWIDSLDGGSSASLANSPPAVSSLHNGILLGFFFPLMPIFFFRATKPALFWDDGSEHEAMTPSIFSRRMQMGIVVGFLLNVLFGLWTYLLSSS
ncbi:hypothetical protein L226DRAFT_458376 [Lentinus tigrinus ALCF2SS1-7]|uniref:Ubiquitin-like domain-containing protein n=1 Tax=Lentinus tigrinus ALCF2SS1-6 TaxID=1328759 RepID=A0A5C2SFK4_9APHY|nr:hypothetical protein L227DRAFT_498399 [Lentinus tigrinus ALCF2SS1-6]RPD77656.1 hypothetical protein L226DRAFT_458376 [Lentinus tigrinus ALCF2SS1-7]